jgi:hypothetical protein
MDLKNEFYQSIIHYDLNKEHLFKEFREKYIGINKEDFVGELPVWSDATTTGINYFNTSDSNILDTDM